MESQGFRIHCREKSSISNFADHSIASGFECTQKKPSNNPSYLKLMYRPMSWKISESRGSKPYLCVFRQNGSCCSIRKSPEQFRGNDTLWSINTFMPTLQKAFQQIAPKRVKQYTSFENRIRQIIIFLMILWLFVTVVMPVYEVLKRSLYTEVFVTVKNANDLLVGGRHVSVRDNEFFIDDTPVCLD